MEIVEKVLRHVDQAELFLVRCQAPMWLLPYAVTVCHRVAGREAQR